MFEETLKYYKSLSKEELTTHLKEIGFNFVPKEKTIYYKIINTLEMNFTIPYSFDYSKVAVYDLSSTFMVEQFESQLHLFDKLVIGNLTANNGFPPNTFDLREAS